jgi:transposase
VSADGAEWIHDAIRERAPRARICLDSYHAVAWANKALEELRRRLAAELRATGTAELADTHWAVIKNSELSVVDLALRVVSAGGDAAEMSVA